MILALLKAGFKEESIMEMGEADAEGYLSIMHDALSNNQGGSKTYRVKRGAEKKQTIQKNR